MAPPVEFPGRHQEHRQQCRVVVAKLGPNFRYYPYVYIQMETDICNRFAYLAVVSANWACLIPEPALALLKSNCTSLGQSRFQCGLNWK